MRGRQGTLLRLRGGSTGERSGSPAIDAAMTLAIRAHVDLLTVSYPRFNRCSPQNRENKAQEIPSYVYSA